LLFLSTSVAHKHCPPTAPAERLAALTPGFSGADIASVCSALLLLHIDAVLNHMSLLPSCLAACLQSDWLR
jgi:ATP-dependent Zn protease